MESDPIAVHLEETGLVGLEGVETGRLEELPLVWEAAEAACSPELLNRVGGVERLIAMDSPKQSPLIVYLFASRLTEPDIELRTRIVKSIGGLEGEGSDGTALNEAVRKTLSERLAAMRTREIYALLQVALYDKSAEEYVANLLSGCSFAGDHLSQILSNRDIPLEIRRQAAYFIGLLGYLDALPIIERLASRLESRGDEDAGGMLPVLQNAMLLLTAL
jgi:hypothetical protein